jgi:hypothetical protein
MKTLEPRKPGKARGTDDAEIQGYNHGRNAQLHHAVSGSSTQTTLIGASK